MDYIAQAKAHNRAINDFINITLREKYGDKISMSDWFKAQQDINEQEFYKKGMAILKPARAAGIDIKMNMQSCELVW